MSQSIRSARIVVAVTAVMLAFTGRVPGAEPPAHPATIDTFTKDGASFFALSLSPTMARPAAKPRDVVLLFDTSASQVGAYRDKALAALDTALAALAPTDRVRLYAVDLEAIPLTDSFVAPRGAEMRQALAALRNRVPLGSTDMAAAVSATAASYAGADRSRGRAALYIGDGMSTANLLAADTARALVDRLAAEHVPLNSYAVGPRVDKHLLACLANQTGGAMAVDREDYTAAQIGNWLAAAVDAPVVWPQSLTLPESLHDANVSRPLPLRFDRETVIVGQGTLTEPADVKMTADADGQSESLSWTVAPSASNPDYAFLAAAVEQARHDGGLTLPALGRAGLSEMQRLLSADAQTLDRLARVALASGDVAQARELASHALAADGADAEAGGILRITENAEKTGGAVPALKFSSLTEEAAPQPTGIDADGGLLKDVENQRLVQKQALQTEVRTAVDDARRQMVVDPAAVTEGLKFELERVRKAPELDAAVRAQLVGQLETALQEASRRSSEKVERDVQRQELQAQRDARGKLVQELQIDQGKVAQYMDRFNSLLNEQKFRSAEEEAMRARDILPNATAAIVGPLEARTMGYVADMRDIVERRHKGVVETLYSVEVAHIPTSDEPPIVYPSAEDWMMKTERRKKYGEAVSLYRPGSSEEKIYRALGEKTDLEFDNMALSDVVRYLSDKHEIPIDLDAKGLADAAVDSSAPVTRNIKGIALKSALKLMLDEFDLTYVVQDEVLKITSKEKADEIRTTRVYPVADLVIPVMTRPVSGMGGMGGMGGGMMGGMGGGMMGGMGGGMGGMGGGMMGGMGGMGGGMGGMGGGMGGGMFNVPAQSPTTERGLRAFAVKDDLKTAPKTVAARPAELKLTAGPTPAASIAPNADQPATVTKPVARITLPAGSDPTTAWNDYFTTHDESPAVVRETVRRLSNEKQFGQVIDLIMAALRHQQPQPWMYEAMGLAMQADGRSLADIDRVLMSAVDFVDGTDQMFYLAEYLANAGLEKRALQLFRQVVLIEPNDPKPYIHGLRLAKKLDDVEAIEWATTGLLGMAWNDSEAAVWHEAYDVAAATLDRLRTENRKAEADAYQKKLDQCMIRDVVVQIKWTGDADIDLLVEEPSGTICSSREPRTVSGGALLGDSSAQKDPKSSAASTESYVCPTGFNGTYRVLVRRVWGKLATGKVTLDIYTHYLSDKETHIHQQIPLPDDEALVLFDLQEGRRTEPLAKQKLATAVAKQVRVGQQILGQQLAAAADQGTLSNFLNSRGIGAAQGFPVAPFFLRGAVGYQPVITVLPSGANMSTNAVVSHDRRYVRVSPVPFFSGIGQVNTFNYVTGSSGTSGGGNTGSGTGGSSGFGGGSSGLGGGGTGGF